VQEAQIVPGLGDGDRDRDDGEREDAGHDGEARRTVPRPLPVTA
jgi:hypothetical protein